MVKALAAAIQTWICECMLERITRRSLTILFRIEKNVDGARRNAAPCITDFSAYTFSRESQAVQQKPTQRAVTAAATTQSRSLVSFFWRAPPQVIRWG